MYVYEGNILIILVFEKIGQSTRKIFSVVKKVIAV